MIELFKMIKGLSATPWSRFLMKAEDTSTRGHTYKLVKKHIVVATHVCTSFPSGSSIDGIACHRRMSMLSLSTASKVDWRKGMHGKWTF